ncbi:MAG: adenosine deaminase [Bacteroidota bacterium]|nr:adenosine deaminase [Bacteroidota bacterium]
MSDLNSITNLQLSDLHCHLGATTSAHLLWDLAHEQGLKLPTKDYWEFVDQIDVKKNEKHKIYLDRFKLTQFIQSSPLAVEKSVYNAISSAFRKSKITTLEIRFNPLLRNRSGDFDIDQIIISAIIGMKRACVVYPVRAGIIIETDRTFDEEKAIIAAKKAVKYKSDGIVGFDMSGFSSPEFNLKTFKKAFEIAKEGGLKTTMHTGEVTGTEEMWEIVNYFKPNRIGHGIACVKDRELMKHISNANIVLELCPTSNLRLGIIKDIEELRKIINTLKENNVKFCINSDGPEFLKISVSDELSLLYSNGILNLEEIKELATVSHDYSFI